MDMMRDHAATEFVHHTGSTWRPRTGSMVNRQHMTAALIDSRDFLAAKRRAETEVMLPAGPKVALTGGTDFNDHRLIWGKLDQVRTKYPDMVLLHGGGAKGAELIAAKWAEARGVTQVAFKPDWTKHAKAAPFKRNALMLGCMPIGVVVFPDIAIRANLADKAPQMDTPAYCMATGSARAHLFEPINANSLEGPERNLRACSTDRSEGIEHNLPRLPPAFILSAANHT